MRAKLNQGVMLPIILFLLLISIAGIILFIASNTPKEEQSPKDLLAYETKTTPSPTPIPLISYEATTMPISFKFPIKMDAIDDTRQVYSIGNGSAELIFSVRETVLIHKLHLCELTDNTECLYDGHANQQYVFDEFSLDGKKAKSFYYRDANGQNWHVVSLSEYEEFQIMILEKYDDYYDELIGSFNFKDNDGPTK